MRLRRSFLTILVAILAYKLMVVALSLMNRASDAALYGGEFLLLSTAAAVVVAVRLLWRRSVR